MKNATTRRGKANKGSRTLVVVRDASGKLISATTRPEREPERVQATWEKRPRYV